MSGIRATTVNDVDLVDSIVTNNGNSHAGLLEERGLVDPVELDRALQAFLARASPASGARVVARAWVDDGFRARLLTDANAALPGANNPSRL